MINKQSRKIKLAHVFRMTDETGILHHSNNAIPDKSKGYSTVDNARALIMAVKLYDQTHSERFENLIFRYVSFLSGAQNEDGTFRTSMGHEHQLLEEKGTEDCMGRCLWALCYTHADQNTPKYIKDAARLLIDKALPHCRRVKSSRAIAYVIIGLKYLDQTKTDGYISELAALLVDHYIHYKEKDWHWFEDRLTCCNAALPWALLTAFKVTKEARYLKVGLESLRFLESKIFTKDYFKPIGINGLLYMGQEAARVEEHPVEACEAASVYIEAFLLTNNDTFIDKAKTCFYWYLGRNSNRHTLLDPETGGCHDGINADDRLNPNQGAESIHLLLAGVSGNQEIHIGSVRGNGARRHARSVDAPDDQGVALGRLQTVAQELLILGGIIPSVSGPPPPETELLRSGCNPSVPRARRGFCPRRDIRR